MESGFLMKRPAEAGSHAIYVQGLGNIPTGSHIRFTGHDKVYKVLGNSIFGQGVYVYLDDPLEHRVEAKQIIYLVPEREHPLTEDAHPTPTRAWTGDLGQEVQIIKQLVTDIHAALHTDNPPPQHFSPVPSFSSRERGQGFERLDEPIDELTKRVQHLEGAIANMVRRYGRLVDSATSIEGVRKEQAKRIKALESRVDRVQESAAGGIDANHLSSRIGGVDGRVDGLVDLATAIEGGQMKLTERIEAIEIAVSRLPADKALPPVRSDATLAGKVSPDTCYGSAEEVHPIMPMPVGSSRERGQGFERLDERIDDLEGRVDRVHESGASRMEADHLSKRIDDLVDLATAIEGGHMELTERIEQIENRMASRVALDVLAKRIEDLENPNR